MLAIREVVSLQRPENVSMIAHVITLRNYSTQIHCVLCSIFTDNLSYIHDVCVETTLSDKGM